MKIIANPRAGHGRGARNLSALQEAIRRGGYDCSVVATEHPGHATELARRLADAGEPRIAVFGGDGTIGESVDGLVGSETELAILPTGTGNDVARSLDIPRDDLARALDLAERGTARPIDVGRERDRHFVSVLGLGFPTDVADQANRIGWLHGSPAFFVAVYKALGRLRPVPLRIELDDRALSVNCVAVLVQNTPYTGGGLHMAPGAEVDDGQFDVVIVEEIGKLDLMVHFPKTYSGRHFEHRSFSLRRSSRVTIHSPTSMPKMFDGDLCGRTPVEACVVPGGVRIVAPAA